MSDTEITAIEADEPETALEEAFVLYRDAGLRLPPVPRELAEALEQQADWQWATLPTELTDRAGFIAEASKPDTTPQVAFGHTGHGVANWYLCYRLVRGPLAVFVRQRFGSPYEDEEIGLAVVNAATLGVETLVVAADAARDAGRIAADQRLLVVIDDVEDTGWQILGAGGTNWKASDSPIAEAASFLEAG